ncbi:putative membrane protein [Crocosphaera subtropica ATCC 51142]|uniref:Membrane protein n=2 Tax=Crocosphaera TaxID=263510 RepID=B1WTH8_CROS5|nr:putative membrane protein [Crocosphaera subtropica ATCC 51142]
MEMMKIPRKLWLIFGISSLVLFFCASLRHWLFQSNALDLGWFDQSLYLISQGKPPIVSFSEDHILGDHAAFIFYPLALFYVIYSNVHWLFLIQAIALSISIVLLWLLAKQAGLKDNLALTIVGVYLLYPLIFNVNLFDFHSEVIALPTIFWAVLAARSKKILQFIIAIILILSCKAVLSLTVAAMGVWLLFFENRKKYGILALFLGVFWFIITTQLIIPQFSGDEVAAVGRYSFLGDSVIEILTNLILKPNIILSRFFTLANLEYIILLFIPVIWGLSPRYLTPLVAAIPALTLNLLTDYQPQKDLVHQYSIPILPFLLLSVIATLAANKSLFRQPKYIILWSLIAFLALGKYGYFTSRYLEQIETVSAMREAVKLVPTEVKVLTSPQISPHLTHRSVIKLAIKDREPINVKEFDYILLNTRYPGWENSQDTVNNLVNQLENNSNFILSYKKDGVFLFNSID